jgi:hypothetical protein
MNCELMTLVRSSTKRSALKVTANSSRLTSPTSVNQCKQEIYASLFFIGQEKV